MTVKDLNAVSMRALLSKLRKNNIQVRLADGELSIKYHKEKIEQDLLDEILFHKTALIDYLSTFSRNGHTALTKAEERADYPLSSSQRRLWVLSQFEQGSVAYNMPGVYNFEGQLDITALSFAFNMLIQRHESLRTIFRQTDQGEPRQLILPADVATSAFRIVYTDLQKEPKEVLRRHIEQDLKQPFDLVKGPLIRASLYQVAANRWVFTYVMHHICGDGWSMEILIRELLSFYMQHLKGEQPSPAPLSIQYKDYACWLEQQLIGDALALHKKYWMQQLQGAIPVLKLPVDKSRPAVKTYNGSSINKRISAELTAALRTVCNRQDATLFMGLLASVATLLYHYSEQQDIIIGSPVAGREHMELNDQVGCYLNTLALRLRLDKQFSFTDLLQHTRQITLDAYQHQVYPFDKLIEDLQLQRDMSRSPLFDVLIDYHDLKTRTQQEGQAFDGINLRISPLGNSAQPVSKFDLTFMFIDSQDGLNLL
ncbi:condensation domain-containing protein, partial [uncultured Chitinophaga sp.]|uniref:condensation domain-containing protein n=1 Tax=uncultured Chitinophaga sp. TaxID=339340 RepID=UPI002637D688